MSKKRGDKDYIGDIKDAIDKIRRHTKGYTFEKFVGDDKTQDAVIRNLEVIGESIKNISATLKNKHPDFPWKDMAGLRDKLIHHYFGINFEIVWQVVTEELPGFASKIGKILGNK